MVGVDHQMYSQRKTGGQTCSCHSTREWVLNMTHIFLFSSGLALSSHMMSQACPGPSWIACAAAGELWACHVVLTLCGVNGSSRCLICFRFSHKSVNSSFQTLRPHYKSCVHTFYLYVLLPDSLTAQVTTVSYCKVKASHCGRQSSKNVGKKYPQIRVNFSQNSGSADIFPR